MRSQELLVLSFAGSLRSLVVVDGRAWGQQRSSTNSSGDKDQDAEPGRAYIMAPRGGSAPR